MSATECIRFPSYRIGMAWLGLARARGQILDKYLDGEREAEKNHSLDASGWDGRLIPQEGVDDY